jgi:hypothetical protein
LSRELSLSLLAGGSGSMKHLEMPDAPAIAARQR